MLTITGYTSYIGMLLLEYTQNNPVMRVFCQILQDIFPDYGQQGRVFKHTPNKACQYKDDREKEDVGKNGSNNGKTYGSIESGISSIVINGEAYTLH